MDGSADQSDTDGDGMNNYAEWRTGTDPTNALSVLKLLAPATTNNASGITITWQSVRSIFYLIQRSSDLSAQPPFSTIRSNFFGNASISTFTDTTATNGGPYFYRVGVP